MCFGVRSANAIPNVRNRELIGSRVIITSESCITILIYVYHILSYCKHSGSQLDLAYFSGEAKHLSSSSQGCCVGCSALAGMAKGTDRLNSLKPAP